MKQKVLLISLLWIGVAACSGNLSPDEKVVQQIKKEIVADLTTNILPFWATKSVDPAGGFYGTLDKTGTPVPDAPKGGILNARLLWTFSTAYRMLGDEQYKTLADRAQRYFIDHFIDREYGGTYMLLNADGTPRDSSKSTYQNSFAIYGLSEHYRATGNQESLDAAISVYKALVAHSYEPEYKGFLEVFTRDWQLSGNRVMKTMNTNLHVLEALTNLYRVWQDAGLKEMLLQEIDVMSNKVLDRKTWHENLYLTKDWQNTMNIDSYGHDIEFSWLLVEAAEVAGDEAVLADCKKVAVEVANVPLQQGYNAEGGMIYEKSPRELDEHLQWWPQAESVVGQLNAWQISGDKKYLDAAVRSWEYIKKYFIDRQYGEWYQDLHPDGKPYEKEVKADQWRCPYHNSRMGFEVMTRFPKL
ncbi:MAG: AGE family epimerase/isomerase [Prevotellaceae bacterium]|jgi:mannobiose 2-epimerase|nr:AGE family epimerase/isomerase [Prevotellaceae bacterium]